MKASAKRIFEGFIYSGAFSALASVSLVFTVSTLLSQKLTWDFVLVIFLATHGPYLYNRYVELKKDVSTNPRRVGFLKRMVGFIPFILILYVALLFGIVLYFQKVDILVVGLVVLLFAFGYSKFFKSLSRKIVAFKDFYVAFWWAFILFIFTIYYKFSISTVTFVSLFVFFFIRFLVNIIFFDIKDVVIDREEGILTFPVVLGVRRTVYMIIFLSLVAVVPLFYAIFSGYLSKSAILLGLTFPYTLVYASFALTNARLDEKIYYLIVDGEEVWFWPLLAVAGSFL